MRKEDKVGVSMVAATGILAAVLVFGATRLAAGMAADDRDPARHAGYTQLLNDYSYGECTWLADRGFNETWNRDDWIAGCKLQVDDKGSR